MLPRLAITLGDPAGIGPEVVVKALFHTKWPSNCQLTLVGNQALLNTTAQCLARHDSAQTLPIQDLNLLEVEPPSGTDWATIQPGQPSPLTGELSFRYLQTAIAHTLAGHFDGIVTAPIAKHYWQAAGHHYPGQTELLAEQANCDRFGMAFVGRSPHTGWRLCTLLATTHIPLRAVPEALTPELLDWKLDLLLETLSQDFGIQQPRIAIAGLNPHSGEQGQLGREETDWLQTWLEQARQRYPHARLDGLVPPDTMWVKPGQAWFQSAEASSHDAYLALYHDQGLIPVKLMAFDRAVNTTIGLPFVRTSPDHGTAFDIAGQGIAQADSMVAAIELAIELVQQRAQVTVALA